MNLTNTQLSTLKASILADPVLSLIPRTADGNVAIASAYNLAATPDFWVWRTSVSRDELLGTTSVDGTVFAWTGTGFITRAQGERDAFAAIFNSGAFVNASLVNVRQAFADIFSGATPPAPANRTHLLTVARRKATRGEKLYATGAGTTASPALMAVGVTNGLGTAEGPITPQNIEGAFS